VQSYCGQNCRRDAEDHELTEATARSAEVQGRSGCSTFSVTLRDPEVKSAIVEHGYVRPIQDCYLHKTIQFEIRSSVG
jgi:hypothetical protein